MPGPHLRPQPAPDVRSDTSAPPAPELVAILVLCSTYRRRTTSQISGSGPWRPTSSASPSTRRQSSWACRWPPRAPSSAWWTSRRRHPAGGSTSRPSGHRGPGEHDLAVGVGRGGPDSPGHPPPAPSAPCRLGHLEDEVAQRPPAGPAAQANPVAVTFGPERDLHRGEPVLAPDLQHGAGRQVA